MNVTETNHQLLEWRKVLTESEQKRIALYNYKKHFVGWRQGKYIFDKKLHWVAFIQRENAWNLERQWLGPYHKGIFYDQSGKVMMFQPDVTQVKKIKASRPSIATLPTPPIVSSNVVMKKPDIDNLSDAVSKQSFSAWLSGV